MDDQTRSVLARVDPRELVDLASALIRRDRLLSHVRLYRALGGGWSLTDVEWSAPGAGTTATR